MLVFGMFSVAGFIYIFKSPIALSYLLSLLFSSDHLSTYPLLPLSLIITLQVHSTPSAMDTDSY